MFPWGKRLPRVKRGMRIVCFGGHGCWGQRRPISTNPTANRCRVFVLTVIGRDNCANERQSRLAAWVVRHFVSQDFTYRQRLPLVNCAFAYSVDACNLAWDCKSWVRFLAALMSRPEFASSLNHYLSYNSIEELLPQSLSAGVTSTTVHQLTPCITNEAVRSELEQCKQTTFLLSFG